MKLEEGAPVLAGSNRFEGDASNTFAEGRP